MQCQQTQILETTLLVVNQDLQVRQGNSSGPRAAHSWEGGRYSNNATETQNSWKRNGGQGSVISVLMGNLNDILGNVEKYILVPFQVCFSADFHWDIFPFPCLFFLTGESMHSSLWAHRGAQPDAAPNLGSPMPLHISKSIFPIPLTTALASQVPRKLHLIFFSSCLSSLPSLSQPVPQLLMSSPILTQSIYKGEAVHDVIKYTSSYKWKEHTFPHPLKEHPGFTQLLFWFPHCPLKMWNLILVLHLISSPPGSGSSLAFLKLLYSFWQTLG